MTRRRCIRPIGWGIGMLACAGLVAGHTLGYVIAEPHGHERAALLDATGHGALWVVVAVALGAAVSVLAPHVLARAPSSVVRSRSPVRMAFTALCALQVIAFLLLEGLERAVSLGSALHILTEPAVAAGIAAQIVVALVAAVAYTAVVRARTLSRPRAYDLSSSRVLSLGAASSCLRLPVAAARAAWNRRGPPLPALLRH